MLNKEFQGVLVKSSPASVNENVVMKVAIKAISTTPSQNFLDTFEDEMGSHNIKSLFRDTIQWRSLLIDTSDWTNNQMKVEFDSVDFIARLSSIKVSRKTNKKTGEDTYEYVMEFIKELGVDNEDTQFAGSYLKAKEEDENGKNQLMWFSVLINRTTDVVKVSIDEDEDVQSPF